MDICYNKAIKSFYGKSERKKEESSNTLRLPHFFGFEAAKPFLKLFNTNVSFTYNNIKTMLIIKIDPKR